MITVEFIKNHEDAQEPRRMTEFSSGFDLYYCGEDQIIRKNTAEKFDTGISIKLPMNYEAQIRSRSGLAFNNNIFVLNSPGTIDQDYRGSIIVLLYNLGNEDYLIKKHNRVAQLVVQSVELINMKMQLVDNIDNDTVRGTGGIGHTGL